MQTEGRRYSQHTHLCLSASSSVEKIRSGSRSASFTPQDFYAVMLAVYPQTLLSPCPFQM